MKISKRKLISLLSESSDVNEMGVVRDQEFAKKRVIFNKNGDEWIGFDLQLDYSLNPKENPDAPRVQIFFTCGIDIEQWLLEHPEEFEYLKGKYGDSLRFSPINTNECRSPFTTNPHRSSKWSTGYPIPGIGGDVLKTFNRNDEFKDMDESEKLKRDFLELLRKKLSEKSEEGEEFINVLNDRSIPPPALLGGDEDLLKKKTQGAHNFYPMYYDTHNEVFNTNEINFTIKSFNVYESLEQFNEYIAKRAFKDPDVKVPTVLHLSRQFNNGYKNWNAEHKLATSVKGSRTPVYKIYYKGIIDSDNMVMVESLFKVTGKLSVKSKEKKYEWTINLSNKIATRKPGTTFVQLGSNDVKKVQYNIDNSFSDDGIQVKKIIDISSPPPPPERTQDMGDDEYAKLVTNYEKNVRKSFRTQIFEGLIDAIEDLKSKIESISPETMVNYTTPTKSELDPLQRMNENKMIKKLVSNIMNELKYKR